jgi:hypothetical protein
MATDVTIAIAARTAGFDEQNLKTAVMVALAESGGNEFATNRNTNGTTDYGLWQINSIHTDALKLGNWQVPTDNAKMAYMVFKQRGSWSAWSAYNNNSYLKFEVRARTALVALGLFEKEIPDAIKGATDGPQLPGGPGTVDTIAKFFEFISDKHNWQRLGMIVVGAFLVNIVFLAVMKDAGVIDAATKTIGAVKGLVL